MAQAPFARGSVSLRLYPHNDLPAPAIVDEMRAQAALGVERGFDGVMTSEHHGGFAGYLPNPLQVAGWCLEAMPRGWAGPCPLLLTLRPPALVAEETAWLAARFPDRVGVGVAAGALQDDFEIMGLPMDDRAARFANSLEEVVGALSGSDPRDLAGDPAIKACAEHPVPVVSAAMSIAAVRRAARHGVGILFDSLSTPERCRELSDAYRAAAGAGPCILIRRAWIGEPPREGVARQVDVYRTYAPAASQTRWEGEQLVASASGGDVGAGLADAARRAGADAVNIRIHVSGVTPESAREQIARLGDAVIPALREELS
ncbi:MAG TPA: LLM class flavin-dependent oxidoreductase [Acidimicrobiia bacterium]|nr:LLM class flavin-dependent oxidoreductase [Acidimicrobiia bacterium]